MSNKKLIKEILKQRNPEVIFIEDKFDEALVGSAIQCGGNHVAIYDSNKCIEILMKIKNIGELEAFEEFEYTSEFSNSLSNKPMFFSDFRNIKEPNITEINIDKTINDIL